MLLPHASGPQIWKATGPMLSIHPSTHTGFLAHRMSPQAGAQANGCHQEEPTPHSNCQLCTNLDHQVPVGLPAALLAGDIVPSCPLWPSTCLCTLTSPCPELPNGSKMPPHSRLTQTAFSSPQGVKSASILLPKCRAHGPTPVHHISFALFFLWNPGSH